MTLEKYIEQRCEDGSVLEHEAKIEWIHSQLDLFSEMEPMRPDEFAIRMKRAAENPQIPEAHEEMDFVMIEQLARLGFKEGAKIWSNRDKWFA